MAVTFIATACPAVQVPAAPVWLGDTVSNPPTAIPLPQALGASGTSDALNENSKNANLSQRYGSGGYGVGYGLALSAGTGLTGVVANGQAVIDGVVEVYNLSAIVLTASSNNWVWLKQDGTIYIGTTTTKPSGNCCLLGCLITNGSGVTSSDTSGVVYWNGGLMWRTTADAGMPADTPDSSLRFYTQTLGGVWFWNGASYAQVVSASGQLISPYNQESLSATKTLVAGSPNVQWLKALNADRIVKLPSNASVTPGHEFRIYNAGNAATPAENYNLTLQDSTGTAITGGSIPPGSMTAVSTRPDSSGAASWPTSVTVAAY